MWFVYLLVSLALTALFYTGPILIYRFAIKKEPIIKKHAITVTIICGFVMYLVMWIAVHSITDTGANATACTIWSFVNYHILTKGAKSQENVHKQYDSTEYYPNTIKQTKEFNKIKFCRKCGKNLVENSNFCNSCGAKIDWN